MSNISTDPYEGPLTEEFWKDAKARLVFNPDGWKDSEDAPRHFEFISRGATEGEKDARAALVRAMWSLKHAQGTTDDVALIVNAVNTTMAKIAAHALEVTK